MLRADAELKEIITDAASNCLSTSVDFLPGLIAVRAVLI
jgi:hypothetical protein